MKRFAAIFLLIAFFGLASCRANGIVFNEYVFSGSMPLTIQIQGKNAKKAYNEILKTLNDLNEQININDERLNTDIKKLNQAGAGERIGLANHAYYLLAESKKIFDETDGAFNISALPLSRLWRVDTLSLKAAISNNQPPSLKEIQALGEACDLNNLILHEDESGKWAEKMVEGLAVDLGGIAKGYAADLIREICIKYGVKSAWVNLAGNLLYHGNMAQKEGGTVRIVNPFKYDFHTFKNKSEQEYLCAFKRECNETASTSGDYQRYKYIQSLKVCHIIDSRRGMPYSIINEDGKYKQTDDHIISCTAITYSSMLADAYTTAACVQGIEWATDFFDQKGIKAIIVTADKRISITGDIKLSETDECAAYKSCRPLLAQAAKL